VLKDLLVGAQPVLETSPQVLSLEVLACSPQFSGEDGLRCAGTQSDLLQGQALDFPPEEQALLLRWQSMEGLYEDLQHLCVFEKDLECCSITSEHRQLRASKSMCKPKARTGIPRSRLANGRLPINSRHSHSDNYEDRGFF
jgi:hypothetical protein